MTVTTPATSEQQPVPRPDPNGILAAALDAGTVEQASAVLPSTRRVVSVPVFTREETFWTDPPARGMAAIPNKPLYAFEGAPHYPELLIVRLLEGAGWGAAWRKTWNGVAYWRDVNETVEPGPMALSIVEQITRQAGYEGPWDIIAWRDRQLRILASRPAGGQPITAYMADWLDSALRMGVPIGCFAVVAHHAPRQRPPRRR